MTNKHKQIVSVKSLHTLMGTARLILTTILNPINGNSQLQSKEQATYNLFLSVNCLVHM